MTEGESITAQLNAFVETHAEGWNHEQWLGLLADLEAEGLDVSEHHEVSVRLERTRLERELRQHPVPGLGPKRMEAIAKHFGTLWRLRHASVEEIARVPGMNRAVAGRVLAALK